MRPEVIQRLVSIANAPLAYLAELKGGLIGYTLPDCPEELIHAAGLHPFLIIGTHAPIRHAPALLPDNACSLARSALEMAIEAGGSFAGFLLPQVCDTTKHMCDIWRRRFPDRLVHPLFPPRQVARSSSREWYAQECLRLRSVLEGYVGRGVKDDDLRESLHLYNENRSLLRRLYALKREAPFILTNREFFDIVKAGFFMERGLHTRLVREVVQWAEREIGQQGANGDRFSLVVAGIVVEPPVIYDMIDEVGGVIVGDTLATASRYIYYDADLAMDPIAALVDRHFQRPPFPSVSADPKGVGNELVRVCRGSGADAILLCHIEYCEVQGFELPEIKAVLRNAGVPFLFWETEYQSTHLAQLRTRLEGFRDSVRGIGCAHGG